MKIIGHALFIVSGILLASQPLSAANYQWTGGVDEPWTSTKSAYWTQTAPWNGIPNPSPPTTNDNVFLGTTNNMIIRATTATNGGAYAGAINDLTVSTTSAAGGSLSSYNGWISTLTIGNNIEFGVGATLLNLSDRNNQSTLTVNVGNDVNIGAGQQLYLGYSGASQSLQKLTGFTVGKTTTVSGALKNGWANSASTINLGDLVLSGTGALTLAAELASTTTSNVPFSGTVSVRSLAGTGNVIGSDSDNTGLRTPTLSIATVAASNETFGGVLSNSSVVSSGTNKLQLAVSGSGRQTLTGTNTYTGATDISGGTLILDGTGSINSTSGILLSGGSLIQSSSTALTAAVTWTGGTVGGSGAITGNLTASGAGAKFLSPGESPGKLTVSGNVSLDINTTFQLELNGTSSILYDSLSMGGVFNINNAALNVSLGYTPMVNDEFTIATFSSMTGLFSGRADGDEFLIGSSTFKIDYGDTDIKLRVVPEPGSISLLLLGAAGMLLSVRRRSN